MRIQVSEKCSARLATEQARLAPVPFDDCSESSEDEIVQGLETRLTYSKYTHCCTSGEEL